MTVFDLSGQWQCTTSEGSSFAHLPGTLDENGIGHSDLVAAPWHPDENGNEALAAADVIATRFTRRFTYEGAAVFTREVDFIPAAGKRTFLECERARKLSLCINGQEIPHFIPPSLSTPQLFEVTNMLTGRETLALTSDNSYPGWPHDDIVYSSAATDETQTNWNGILGFFRLRVEEPVFIHALRAYSHGNKLDVCAEISADCPWEASLTITSDALLHSASIFAQGDEGFTSVWLCGLHLRQDVCRWDEDEGNLNALTATLDGLNEQGKSISFGVRDFSAKSGHLALNGRNIFLRCETNCAVFPETGRLPMDVESWREILSVYRSYGVNCMRFHSHCPPSAAFDAADEMGMMMQPELSHWNPRNAFSSPESQTYYKEELTQILLTLANHPSFVMLTLGNELQMDESGHAFAAQLLHHARTIDSTRLYAEGSNNHYGRRGVDDASDFYSSFRYFNYDLRATSSPMVGWLNECYPDWRSDYCAAMKAIRKKHDVPVFSFEVGQYEVLPDFDEVNDFRGVTIPDNLRLIQRKVVDTGLLPRWKEYVHATGELSLLSYRAEIEAALRTEGMSGISLLGLQDFPGQGTALVGMLNSHLNPKPFSFAQPERFSAFFTSVLPLALLPRFTYLNTDTLTVQLRIANYGKSPLSGTPEWKLDGNNVSLRGTLDHILAPTGGLGDLGTLSISLDAIKRPMQLTFTVGLCGYGNTYPIWVYPDEAVSCPDSVYECRILDDDALRILSAGGTVYLAPDSTKEALPHSIKGQFTTDFWSVGTFPSQDGAMGQLIDVTHPIFQGFPTDTHTNYQWWPMACQRAVILPESLREMNMIVTTMDSYAYLRPMAQLFECRCGGGKLLFSSLNLHNLMQYPEARALQSAIYRYLSSSDFLPSPEVSPELLNTLLR